jgi:hypothetical protein
MFPRLDFAVERRASERGRQAALVAYMLPLDK